MMHVNFEELAQALSQSLSVQSYNTTAQGTITEIKLFPSDFIPGQTSLDPAAAYLCEYRELRLYEPHMEFPPLICVIEPGISVDTVFFRSRTIMTVIGCTVNELLLRLTELLYEYGCARSPLTEISQTLLQCQNLDQMILEGYRILQNPILVTDCNQKILAYTDPKKISARAYRTIAESGHLPVGHPDSKSNSPWSDRGFSMMEVGSAEVPPGICQPLSVRSKIVGYLHVPAFNHPISERDLHVIELLSNLMAVELWHLPHQQFTDPEMRKEHFYREILDNTAGEISDILSTQQQLHIHLNPYLYTLVVQLRDAERAPRESFYTLSKELSEPLPNCFGFLYRNSALLILDAENEITDFSAYLAPVAPILDTYNLAAGISNSFPLSISSSNMGISPVNPCSSAAEFIQRNAFSSIKTTPSTTCWS